MPKRIPGHIKRATVRNFRQFQRLDEPIQRLVLIVSSIAVFVGGALSMSLWNAWSGPAPVATYDFEPLMIGRLDDDQVVIEQTNGVPTVVAIGSEVTVPMVFGRCSDDTSSALSYLTVLAEVGLDTPTLLPRDEPALLVVEEGCTGVVGTEVLISTPPDVLRDGAFFSLRFRISADGKLPVVVETEPFLIAEELPVGEALVRPVPVR